MPRSDDAPSGSENAGAADLTGKRVLVIEDSKELRELVGLLLQSFGCEVVSLDGGESDFDVDNIDIILSDVVLPGRRQGPDLAEAAIKRNPAAKLLFMSGYPRDRLTENWLVTDTNLLKKPFSRRELEQKLNEVFGSG